VTLARLCEEAGIDLQVVLLVREKWSDLIRSTVDTRNFGGVGKEGEANEIKILGINAEAFHSQVAALDPRFIAGCYDQDHHYFDGLEDLAKVTGLPSLPAAIRDSVDFKPSLLSAEVVQHREVAVQRRRSLAFALENSIKQTLQLCPSFLSSIEDNEEKENQKQKTRKSKG
jgi:hypothetical protein